MQLELEWAQALSWAAIAASSGTRDAVGLPAVGATRSKSAGNALNPSAHAMNAEVCA